MLKKFWARILGIVKGEEPRHPTLDKAYLETLSMWQQRVVLKKQLLPEMPILHNFSPRSSL